MLQGGAYAFQYPNDVTIGPDGLLLAADSGFYRYPLQCPLTTAVHASPAIPTPLLRVGPNPMRAQLTARFALPTPAAVSLTVYDVQGRRIRALLSGHQATGEHVAIWDGLSDRGGRAANGVYWLRLEWPGGTSAQPVTVLR